jgi:NADH-quinone oxidoreductase subunit M
MIHGVVTSLVALPFATAALISKNTGAARARAIATVAMVLELLAGIAATVWLTQHHGAEFSDMSLPAPWLKARWHVELDGLSAPFVPMVAAVGLAVLVGAPRRETDAASVRGMLLTLGCIVGVYSAEDLLLFAGFWIIGFVPSVLALKRHPDADVRGSTARAFSFFAALGSLSLFAATLLVAYARWNAPLPFDLDERTSLPASYGTVIFALLAIALLARKGVLPFHSWLPVLIERGPIPIAIFAAVPHLSAFALLRVTVPLVPLTADEMLPLLAVFALASAMYLSVVALSQQDIRRTVGYVTSSCAALVLVGICALDPEGIQGGILQTISLGIGTTGLILTTSWLQVRAGTVDLREMGGMVARFPKMAWAFLLLGLCLVGAPGTIGWIAEDLLLHALLVQHPLVATLFLLVNVLNGVTILRVFFLAFLGPTRGEIGPSVTDLQRRESLVAFAVIGAAVAFGLAPQQLLNLRSQPVQEILRTHYAEYDAAHAARGHTPR